MKKIIALLLLAASSIAFAASDTNTLHSMGFNELPEAERAAILQQVAAAKAKAVTDKAVPAEALAAQATPQKVGEWLEVGTKIGQMFGGAAKEVGLAVNDFVKTPVGQWTMAIIIWKYMGGVIIHVTAGLVLLVLGSIFAWLIYRAGRSLEVEYDLEKKNVFGNYPVKHVKKGNYDTDYMVGAVVVQIAVVVASMICIFTF